MALKKAYFVLVKRFLQVSGKLKTREAEKLLIAARQVTGQATRTSQDVLIKGL